MSNDLIAEPMSERDIRCFNSGVVAVLNEARELRELVRHAPSSHVLWTLVYEGEGLLIGSVDNVSVLDGMQEYEAFLENSEREKIR